MKWLLDAVRRRVWIARFNLEDARQAHGAAGNYWRSAGCCIVLALLRARGSGECRWCASWRSRRTARPRRSIGTERHRRSS